jgi:hypothetical protein
MGLLDYPATPEATAAERLAAPFATAVQNPSGIPQQLADYAYEKPVSAAMNLSTGLGLAGKAAEAGGAARLANVLAKGSEVINPVSLAAGAISKTTPIGNLIRKGTKETIGATTGAGTGAVEEALKGSDVFKKAMRGEITGEEIVDNAKAALNTIKDKRAQEYRDHLANISGANTPGAVAANIDITPIAQKLKDQLANYNIKMVLDPATNDMILDTSRVAMGHKGIKDIEGIIKELNHWGSQPGDLTAVGLDTLKRRLADFYSDSSQARQFVASMENVVKKTIEKAVPEYGEMTKGYAEATSLIKDIESGLMMRKQGMTGRVTADQTLRRLTSSMRENFEMRRDLVDALGVQGGQDIAGQVAGYAMSSAIPRGLVGKVAGGSAGYLVFVHPKFWPVLAASSPRVMGEFLTAYGAAMRKMGKITGPLEKVGETIAKPEVANAAFQAQQIGGLSNASNQ